MASKNLIVPRTLKGCLDLLPEEAIARNQIIDRIRKVYESYGYAPLDTPVLEYIDTLLGTGGEETNKELFRLESPEGDAIALRFDLTVPFARLLAQYPEQIKPPVRRYHIGPVFRGDKPDPGRYRQFTQCDIDVAGSASPAMDAEVIAVMCDVMKAIGITQYRILINNRKLIDALLDDCGIHDPAVQKHALRVVDKLGKVGIENIIKELGGGRIDDSGDPIRGVGLAPATIDKLIAFISLKAPTRAGMLAAWEERLAPSVQSDGSVRPVGQVGLVGQVEQAGPCSSAAAAIAEMRELADALDGLGIPEENAVFDPSLARGLDYYTGPVFENTLPQAPEFGSIGGGGRYDGLVSRFLPQPIPATGFSVGLDRLIAALRHLGALETRRGVADVIVVTMRGVAPKEYLRLASEIRAGGLACEVYFGRKKDGVSQQLSYANDKGIPVAVIVGGDELAAGTVSIKDLNEGREAREGIADNEAYRAAGKAGQQTILRADMVARIRQILSNGA